MKYRRIQYFIIYFLLILCLFLSKEQLDPANSVWIFLFNNHNETNHIIFICINLFYLIIISLYIPTKKSMFTILHFIFNKLYYFEIILFLLDKYYLMYLKYFKLKQLFVIRIHLYIISNLKLFNNYYFKGCLHLSIFDTEMLFPDNFKNKKEQQFYLNLYKNLHHLSIYIKIKNHIYKLTFIEFIALIEKHIDLFNKKKSILQFLSKFKILNKLVKLIAFWIQIKPLYLDLPNADFNYGTRFYVRYLLDPSGAPYKIKTIVYLIKLFNKDSKLLRQFMILLLYKNLKLLLKKMKKKKIIFDLDKLCNIDSSISILNMNSIKFRVKKPQSYQNHFNKLEFNLFYLYFKNIHTLKTLYKSIIISNFFKEFKVIYKIIQFSLFFYLVSFFILQSFLSVLIPIYFLSIFFLKLFYTHYIIGNKKYWSKKRLVNHTLFRLFYFYFIYFFNFYFFSINNFYFIILNYLISTFVFIIIISLYDIHSNFFFTRLPLIKLEGISLYQAIRYNIIETMNNWVIENQLNYFSKIYIKYHTFLNKEKTIYSNTLYKEYLKKTNATK